MAAKTSRVQALGELLAVNGLSLSATDDGIQSLNDWFRSEVQGSESSRGRLVSVWYSVVNDIGLFLGDVMIDRCPTLAWAFFDKGAKDAAYQRHVIMGFTRVANPKYNVDVDLLVATYGHRIVADLEVSANEFVQWVEAAESKA